MADEPQIIEVQEAPTQDAGTPEAPDFGQQERAAEAAEQAKAEAEAKAAEKPSIRESIEKAKAKTEAERAEKPEAKPEPKAEKPKAEEAPKAEKLRAQDGKFAPAEPKAEVKPEPKQETTSQYKDAPSRFNDDERKEWEAAPESVRKAVHRMQTELEGGIEKYRAQAAEFEGVKEYAEMAKQYGTNLKTALDNYTGIERLLRTDPMRGLEQIVSNLGLKDGQGQPLTFRALAAAVAGQKPEAVQAQHDATISQLRQQVSQLTQQLGGVTKHLQQAEQQHRSQTAEGEWTAFVRENPRAGQLEAEIAAVLQQYPANGNIPIKDRLADAFAIASARNPAPASAHTDAVAPLAHTQTAQEPRQIKPEGQKSVSGAPSAGTTYQSRPTATPPSIKEALQKAARRNA